MENSGRLKSGPGASAFEDSARRERDSGRLRIRHRIQNKSRKESAALTLCERYRNGWDGAGIDRSGGQGMFDGFDKFVAKTSLLFLVSAEGISQVALRLRGPDDVSSHDQPADSFSRHPKEYRTQDLPCTRPLAPEFH